MANESDFTIEGLDKFIEGISKLNKAGDKLVKAFGALPAGRSKEAKEARISGLGSIQELGNALKRSTSTINAYNRAMSQYINRETRIRNLDINQKEQAFQKTKKQDNLKFKQTNIELDRQKRADKQKEREDISRHRKQSEESKLAAYSKQTELMLDRQRKKQDQKVKFAEEDKIRRRKEKMKFSPTNIVKEFAMSPVRALATIGKNTMKGLDKMFLKIFMSPISIMNGAIKTITGGISFALSGLWNLSKGIVNVAKGIVTAIPGALKTLYNYSGKIAGQRETTLGQGINVQAPKYLEAAFSGAVGGTADITSAIVEAQRTPGSIFPVRAGISPEDDAGMATLKAMDFAREVMSKTPKSRQENAYNIFGIKDVMSFQQATDIGALTEEEYKSRRERAAKGMAEGKVNDKAIAEFHSRIKTMGVNLETYMVNSISPMLGPIESLGMSLVDLFKSLAGPDILPKVIDQLQIWAKELTAWIGKPETKELVESTIKKLNEQFNKFEKFLKETDWTRFNNEIVGVMNAMKGLVSWVWDKLGLGVSAEEKYMKELYDRDYIDAQKGNPLNAPQRFSLNPSSYPSYETREQNRTKASFVSEMLPYAQKTAEKTGIDPYILLAHAAQETGFGKSVKDNNYFNITGSYLGRSRERGDKDAQGRSIKQRFRIYAMQQQSFDDLADLLARKYPDALGQQDPERYGKALKAGGYAADPEYAKHISERYHEIIGVKNKNTSVSPIGDGRVNNSYMEGMFSFGAQTPTSIKININDALSTGRADITASRSVGGLGGNAIANTLAPMFGLQ